MNKQVRNSIFIFSLLFALPLALRGQANLPLYQGTDWRTLLVGGGVLRHGSHFVRIDRGLDNLMSIDYVNGFALGPKATIGKVLADYSRVEIDANVKWAFSRKQLMARGALRYVFAPQYFGFIEVMGGKTTSDFDRYPVMDESQRTLATGVFGWSHFKLYEQRTVGLRLYGAIAPDWQLTALVAYEKRQQVENHRSTNIFGRHAQDNIPVVQGSPMPWFGSDRIMRFDWQIDYSPRRRIEVHDDMNAMMRTSSPTFTLKGTTGSTSSLQFISLEASVQGSCAAWGEKQTIVYQASAGYFPVRNCVRLMDMRHFDASSFWLQRTPNIALFSLLDNYELSTSKAWAEAHAEWNNRLLYAQLHTVKVADCPWHNEVSAGISLSDMMRLGASIGFDNARFDGAAFNFVLKMP